MTAPDVCTAAQAEALGRWPRQDVSVMHDADLSNYLCRHGFEEGAVWGAALVTPTREQIAKAMWEATPTPDRPWEVAPEAVREAGYVLADAVLALMSTPATPNTAQE